MTKYTLFAASLLLAVWCAASWSQEETAQSEPFGEQAPTQRGEDPFGPPTTLNLSPASANGQPEARATAESEEALKRTPVFVAGGQSERNDKVLRALGAPITNVGFNFTETPLSEIVNFLRDEYEIEIQLDTQALDDLGLSPDDTITVNLRNISLSAALKLMLKQHDLTYMIADEVLLITSEDEALARLTVQVYPVGDLLQPKGGQGNGSAATIDDLIQVIISTIASDTWAQNEGGEAEICPLQPGLLIISQTQAVHEGVADLLMALRRARQHELSLPYAPPAKKAKPNFGRGGFGGGAPAEKKSEQKQEKSNPGEQQGGGAF